MRSILVLQTSSVSPLLSSLERGGQAFYSTFRPFSRQFTQTKLIALFKSYLGTAAFHSSQISGFSRGTLTEPAPKVLLALGLVNVALARSIGHPEHLIEQHDLPFSRTLPHEMQKVWIHRLPMLDRESIAMGPTGLFEAFCGLRELNTPTDRHLGLQDERAASEALGAYLRAYFGRHGIDWFSELPALKDRCSAMQPLLLNQPISGEELVESLDQIAAILDSNSNNLWEVIQDAIKPKPEEADHNLP